MAPPKPGGTPREVSSWERSKKGEVLEKCMSHAMRNSLPPPRARYRESALRDVKVRRTLTPSMSAMVAWGSSGMFQMRAEAKIMLGQPGSNNGRGDSMADLTLLFVFGENNN
jgi:hypothetical protein